MVTWPEQGCVSLLTWRPTNRMRLGNGRATTSSSLLLDVGSHLCLFGSSFFSLSPVSCDATRQDIETRMANDEAAFHNTWLACLQRNMAGIWRTRGGTKAEYGPQTPEYGTTW
jgi:hypothetical protein